VLAWAHVDHHFASGREHLGASYRCSGYTADALRITVTAQDASLVYQQDGVAKSDGIHSFGHQLAGWNGKGNQGAWNDRFVTAAQSPYTLTITATIGGATAVATFHVLCRSITLGLGTWTEDGNAPDRNAAPERWVQFKLNQFGYFAGPIDGVITANRNTNQTRRAMMRYANDHAGLTESGAQVLAGYATRAEFVAALTNDTCDHTIVQGGALPSAGAETRVYVNNNYFYTDMAEFLGESSHVATNRAKLDRFEIPIEATVLLLSREDDTGTRPGVLAPEGVGPVKIQWTVAPVAEDLTRYPAASTDRPTRASLYLTNAALGNCPTGLGGSHVAANPNQNHFRVGNDLPPFATANNNDDVYTTAYDGAVVGKRGKAGVLFRGSYVAGDAYQVTAAVSFYGLANRVALEGAHLAALGATWQQKMTLATGTMRVWHRQRVAAVVNWPAPPNGLTIDWAQVAAEYELAYTELVSANAVSLTGAQFRVTYAADMHLFDQTMALALGVPTVTFTDDALVSFDIPAQSRWETAASYKARISEDLNQRFSERNLERLADNVRQSLKRHYRAGSIVINAKWVPTLRVFHVPLKGLGTPTPAEDWDPGLFCVGLSMGVTIFAYSMIPKYADRFLITHEMGHNRFLRHHTKGGDEMGATRRNELGLAAWHAGTNPCANPTSHDTLDTHCSMSYPFALPINPEWNRTGTRRATFCGKCLLKLRGWDVALQGALALPARS
jgi:hypothetical protein